MPSGAKSLNRYDRSMDPSHLKKLTPQQLEQFRDYLDQQESKLAEALLLSTLPSPGQMDSIHLHGSGHYRLTQALQSVSGRIRDLKEEQTVPGEWQISVDAVNKALWTFCDLLEGAANELIQHVQLTRMSDWDEKLYGLFLSFKELLSHRIEDTIWLYRRLEELFLSYRATCKKHKNLWMIFGKLWAPFATILDKNILNRLFKMEEMLSSQFKRFSVSYEVFNTFLLNARPFEEQLAASARFQELAPEQQSRLLKLYCFAKVWEQNSKQQMLNSQELVSTIKELAKPGVFLIAFRDYYKILKEAIFALSYSWQKFEDESLVEVANHIKHDLVVFGELVTSYREILLRSDPNPYVRTRWSFSEWALGPEPRKTRELLQLIFDVEMLLRWCDHLLHAIKSERVDQKIMKRNALKKRIELVIHEMGQPLSSRNMIHGKCEELLQLVEECDELGGSLGDLHMELTDLFLKAMRLDVKYQTLFDFPKFEELYSIHEGFLPPIHDPDHKERLKLYKGSLHHIEHWLKESVLPRHEKEVEVDEAAIQESLQRLLAAIQRGALPQQADRELYFQMLLEYRFLFSKFFHLLRKYEGEGKLIRGQFLFVDNYLEAIEQQLRQSAEPKAVFNVF